MEETVYVVGESRTNSDNAITSIYSSFYIGFEVNSCTDEIVDLGCTHTIHTTEKVLKDIFIGKKINELEKIESEVRRRYHGTSQKAVIVAYKEALKKYIDVKNRFYV